ncbi:MAG: hypothetical protein OXF06_14605 [Bacteroidetes bacterium]|nr:hypothetical protein [Bacteroidota bacterium]MCY4226048.1 hypothetical protein [Bacteroidota bacterium]
MTTQSTIFKLAIMLTLELLLFIVAWVTAIGALITALVAVLSLRSEKRKQEANMSKWMGSVDADMSTFKEFMKEIQQKIDQIFLRLPPLVATKQSPLQLTDLGKEISDKLNALGLVSKFVDAVKDEVKGKEPYDIQEFSLTYVQDDTHYLDKERKLIRRVAYEKGVTEEEFRSVIGLELRDKLLEIEGLVIV